MTHDNDNEELSFITIGLAVRNVMSYLEPRKDKQEQRERDAQRERDKKQKEEAERAYIEQRLRDIASFEERLRPGYRSRRKRN